VDDIDAAMPPEVEVFLDERGSLLRARWSADHRRLMLSVWRDGRCVATHSLARTDAARLSSLLGWASAVDAPGR
jgi:hypothetical protein